MPTARIKGSTVIVADGPKTSTMRFGSNEAAADYAAQLEDDTRAAFAAEVAALHSKIERGVPVVLPHPADREAWGLTADGDPIPGFEPAGPPAEDTTVAAEPETAAVDAGTDAEAGTGDDGAPAEMPRIEIDGTWDPEKGKLFVDVDVDEPVTLWRTPGDDTHAVAEYQPDSGTRHYNAYPGREFVFRFQDENGTVVYSHLIPED